MSTIKSSDEHLTLNADGSSKDIKFQANGVEKASISSAGAFTSTTIDATKLTGNLPAISGANLTGIVTGKVLQVKHYESSGAVTFPQDTSITTTMVSGAITPSATTSKILVLQFMSFGLNGGNYPACSAKLFRDSTEIWQKIHLGYMDVNSFDRRFDFSRANYDSPNTTSEITYYLKGGNGTGSGFSGTYGGAGNKTSPGTLTLIEIGA
jgi:hypothetical protein